MINAANRSEAMLTTIARTIGARRVEILDQHLPELNDLKQEIMDEVDPNKYRHFNEKIDAIIMVIKAERLALALPDRYKYVEQKNETAFKVEDALRELEHIEGNYETAAVVDLPGEVE